MSNGLEQLRTELERKFQPPIDVLLDPSLLVASRSFEQLSDSGVFTSQTQATLGRSPTEPRLGDLYVPAAFRQVTSGMEQTTVQKTDAWDFYRGQAEASFPDDVLGLLNKNDVADFSGEVSTDELNWRNPMDDSVRKQRLLRVLEQELAFLQSGGLLLSRTATSLKALRDAGVPSVDIGKAELDSDLREVLSDIGYENPAGICAFGVSTVGPTTDALVGEIISDNADFLLYRVGN